MCERKRDLNSAVRSRLLQAIAPSVLARVTPRGLGLPCGELWFGTIITWILAFRVFHSMVKGGLVFDIKIYLKKSNLSFSFCLLISKWSTSEKKTEATFPLFRPHPLKDIFQSFSRGCHGSSWNNFKSSRYLLQIPGISWVGDYIAGALLWPCALPSPAQLRAACPLPREHWHSISSSDCLWKETEVRDQLECRYCQMIITSNLYKPVRGEYIMLLWFPIIMHAYIVTPAL